MASSQSAIRTEALTKRYGDTWALAGVDLAVEPGSVLGVLGPNGAGKTTMVRILTTLIKPTGGRALVAGYDVVKQAAMVRQQIALTGQYAALDDKLTGKENLVLLGRLQRLPARAAKRRAAELLERFDLADAADKLAGAYSGGMRRRLDLAASIVVPRPILFLDEPTTGLDPRSRLELWEMIHELSASGVTLVLTSQYLEEADRLADRIVVIDHGHIVAEGTALELKTRVGGQRVEVVVPEAAALAGAVAALAGLGEGQPLIEASNRKVSLPVRGSIDDLERAVRALAAASVPVDDLSLRRPTLDDVFLTLTGNSVDTSAPMSQADAANISAGGAG